MRRRPLFAGIALSASPVVRADLETVEHAYVRGQPQQSTVVIGFARDDAGLGRNSQLLYLLNSESHSLSAFREKGIAGIAWPCRA